MTSTILQKVLGKKDSDDHTPNCGAFTISAMAVPGFADPTSLLIGAESKSAWQTHLQNYLDSFAPANYPETEAVQLLASITWRLSRLTAWETDLLKRSQPVPAYLYQAMTSLLTAYQIALDAMSKLPSVTKASSSGDKVVILVKPPEAKRPAAPNQPVAPR